MKDNNWFDDHLEVIGLDDKANKIIKDKIIDGFTDETPIEIQCPHCDETLTVYHMDWSAIVCLHCKEEVNKEDIKLSSAH